VATIRPSENTTRAQGRWTAGTAPAERAQGREANREELGVHQIRAAQPRFKPPSLLP